MTYRIPSAATLLTTAIVLVAGALSLQAESPSDPPPRHTVRYGGGNEPILPSDTSSSASPRATTPLPSVIYSPTLPDSALLEPEQNEAEDPLAFLNESVPVGYPTLVLYVTAKTVNDQWKQQQITRDPVYDVIEGTSLQGTALSHTTVTPRLLSSQNGIKLALQLHTRALTETTGTSNAATAYNRGVTNVQGHKQIFITPTQFRTARAQATADVQSDIVGFKWERRFGERIARRTADEQEPMLERVSAEHTGPRAAAQFDRQVDRQVAKFEKQYREIASGQMARMPIRPDHVHFRSTQEAAIAEAWFGDGLIGSFPPTLSSNGKHQGVAMQVHQSLLNDTLRQLNEALAGQTLEEDDWAQLNNLLPESSTAPARDGRREWTLQMPEKQPLVARLTNDGVRVSLTVAAFKVGTTAYPGMLIEANFTPAIKDGQMIAVRDERLVLTPLSEGNEDGDAATNPEKAKTGDNEKAKPKRRLGVRQNIFRSMVRKRFDPVFAKELPIGDQHRSLGGNRYAVSGIEITDEWATIQAVPAS